MSPKADADNPTPVNEKKKSLPKKKKTTSPKIPDYPRHSVERALKIPDAILKNNAGHDWSDRNTAKSIGINNPKGPFSVEVGSGIKYGFLVRPKSGELRITDLARKALRPEKPEDRIAAFREAIMTAPLISEVYKYVRGETLPEKQYLENTLTERFKIPAGKISDFIQIFTDSLKSALLLEERNDIVFVKDESSSASTGLDDTAKNVNPVASTGDSCFVIMPFAEPINILYKEVYKPAIEAAGLAPVRADNDIFTTGKIIEQIWREINEARVLIAELTSKNANVFYELGLAHALNKPVILVSRNREDVPFDVHHVRVIFYDINDPAWGTKLISKIKDTLIELIENPKDAILFST